MRHYAGELISARTELASIKVELYGVYEENLKMRDMLKEQEKERQWMRECEAELSRLKGLLREVTEKRENMPS